jgi:hypothetical protein
VPIIPGCLRVTARRLRALAAAISAGERACGPYRITGRALQGKRDLPSGMACHDRVAGGGLVGEREGLAREHAQ